MDFKMKSTVRMHILIFLTQSTIKINKVFNGVTFVNKKDSVFIKTR